MSVSTQAAFESGHTDQIHDCQYDYYGRVSPPSSPDPSFYSENQTPRRSDARPPSPPTVAEGRDLLVRPHDQGVRCRRRAADVAREPDRARRAGLDVRLGSPQVRHAPGVLFVRSQGYNLEGVRAGRVLGHLHLPRDPPRRVRQRHLVGSARVRPVPRVRVFRRLRLRRHPPSRRDLGRAEDSRARTRSAAPRCRGHPRLPPAPWSPPEAPPPRR